MPLIAYFSFVDSQTATKAFMTNGLLKSPNRLWSSNALFRSRAMRRDIFLMLNKTDMFSHTLVLNHNKPIMSLCENLPFRKAINLQAYHSKIVLQGLIVLRQQCQNVVAGQRTDNSPLFWGIDKADELIVLNAWLSAEFFKKRLCSIRQALSPVLWCRLSASVAIRKPIG